METEKQTESEIKQTKIMYEPKLVAEEGLSEDRDVIHDGTLFSLDTSKSSSLTRLLRITLALRFVNKIKKKTNQAGLLDGTEIASAG